MEGSFPDGRVAARAILVAHRGRGGDVTTTLDKLTRTMFEDLRYGVIVLDPDGRVAFANRRAIDALGRELVGRSLVETIPGRLEDGRTTSFLDSIIENLPAMIFVKRADDLRFVRFNRA